ncbi:MAG: hypothetical protein RLY17_1103, partial [Pseudomonadota bacterium]
QLDKHKRDECHIKEPYTMFLMKLLS